MNIKQLLITTSVIAMAITASAQELRLSAGYNGSQVQEAGRDGWLGKGGYQFGADLLLGHQLFLRTGAHLLVRNLNYSYVRADENGLPETTPDDFNYTSRSLRVPAQVGLYLLDPEDRPGFNVYAVGGPSLVYTLSTELDANELEVQTKDAQVYLGFGAGATLGFLFVEGGYDVALARSVETRLTDPKFNYYYLMGGVRLRLAR